MWLPWFVLLGSLFLAVGVIWGLAFAPEDYQQGNSFRIIYIHVPSSVLAQSIYMMLAIAGAVSIIWRIKLANVFLKVVPPIGASMALLSLLSGAIWGKPTWGTWWEWDARLTSMLILLFLYFGIIAIHAAVESVDIAGRAASIVALVGVVNIPIIKYSVEWWNTLHQPATFTLTEKPAMPMDMWLPLLIALLGFYFCFGAWALSRMRIETLYRERKSQWIKELPLYRGL